MLSYVSVILITKEGLECEDNSGVFVVTCHLDTLPWPEDARSKTVSTSTYLCPHTRTDTHTHTANAHQLLPVPLLSLFLCLPLSWSLTHVCPVLRSQQDILSSLMTVCRGGFSDSTHPFFTTGVNTMCQTWQMLRTCSGGHKVCVAQWLSDTVPRLNPLIWSRTPGPLKASGIGRMFYSAPAGSPS